MAPIVDGLEQQFGKQVAVQRINAEVGAGPEIMKAYRIPGHPAVMVVDATGHETARFFGPQSAESLAAELENVLNPSP
jgi:thioredoxin-like negative regulator of GroEL